MYGDKLASMVAFIVYPDLELVNLFSLFCGISCCAYQYIMITTGEAIQAYSKTRTTVLKTDFMLASYVITSPLV